MIFYCFSDKIHTVSGVMPNLALLGKEIRFLVGSLSVAELEEIAPHLSLPAATLQQCREGVRYFRNSLELEEHCSFATVKRTGGSEEGEDCVALYLLKSCFLVVDIRDSDGSTRKGLEGVVKRCQPTVSKGQLVAAFLDTLIEGDGKLLEDLEFAFSSLEEEVLRGEIHRGNDDDFIIRLLHHKQYLLLLHNYYQQLTEIASSLAEDENRLLQKGEARHLRRFADRAERLFRTVSTLREQLGQLREAYQSVLDLRLNAIMKTFTVLSAIFLPLSLIVGWYGMNFTAMPELDWRFGYPMVAVLCGLVTLICIKIFKKHHWM
ncbi:MAG: hypothetical protein E7585_08330 [Ruminococcaceae bacterium]|nr:hypothetical protein [Oscillospiraceae bacterium]